MAKKNIDIDLDALIDAYAEAHEKAAKWEKAKKELRAKILPFCSVTEVLQSDKNAITYSVSSFESLDAEAIRREMPEKWVKKFTKVGERETLKVTNLKKVSKK